MTIDYQIDDRFKQRDDLIAIMKASAEYLKSRDRDPDSAARAAWHLTAALDGHPQIGVVLQDSDYRIARQYSPAQLVPADIRELRMLDLWDNVLKYRVDTRILRTSKILAESEAD